MKKQAKILGSLSAVCALSMGIFAVTPVMAEDSLPLNYNQSGTSANVTVRLRVVGEVPAVQIAKPLDGEDIVGKVIPVKVDYEKSNNLQYELIYVQEDGTKISYDLPTKDVSDAGIVTDGTDTFEVNIDNYGGKFGTYILKARANGSGSATDSVQFTVSSFDVKLKGTEPEDNNPIITIKKNPSIRKTIIQVFDSEGNPVLDEPIEVDVTPGENTDVTIPLSRYGVPDGDYTIVATAYDGNGDIYDTNREVPFTYKAAPAPEVPDTGSIFANLGLSRQDLISTGLALLFVCAFFGILIIAKKSRNQKRR